MNNLNCTRLRELIKYDPSTGEFCRRSSGKTMGSTHAARGYVYIRVDGVRYAAHRLAWLYVHGEWPPAQIDHINRLRNDNRIANLRAATPRENSANRGVRTGSKSGVPGVTWYARYEKWQACTKRDGVTQHLGYFESVAEAKAVLEKVN
jgi:hypothetical protein